MALAVARARRVASAVETLWLVRAARVRPKALAEIARRPAATKDGLSNVIPRTATPATAYSFHTAVISSARFRTSPAKQQLSTTEAMGMKIAAAQKAPSAAPFSKPWVVRQQPPTHSGGHRRALVVPSRRQRGVQTTLACVEQAFRATRARANRAGRPRSVTARTRSPCSCSRYL
jgi:hypothetical protein